MSRYVQFTLPDGNTVIIESDDRDAGIAKAAAGDVIRDAGAKFEQAANSARQAAQIILEKLRDELPDRPDEVEINFGLKASGEVGSLVVARCGLEASYSVTLSWKNEDPPRSAPPTSLRLRSLRGRR